MEKCPVCRISEGVRIFYNTVVCSILAKLHKNVHKESQEV